MCLEPFGATGLFILGRGARLLAAGVVTEKEEEEEKRRGGMGNREEAEGPARLWRPLESARLASAPEARGGGAGPGQEGEDR